jgi:PAS domain S-box-containing protein
LRKTRLPRRDLGRLIAIGAAFMVMVYLVDSIVRVKAGGGSVYSMIAALASRETVLRLAFLCVLFIFALYASDTLGKRRRLEKSLVKYQAAMDASIDGIFLLDSRQRCAYVNNSLVALYRFDTYAELLDKSWRLFFWDEDIARFEREIFPAVAGTGAWRGETVGRRRDGRLFPQEISVAALDGGSIVCIVRDVTAQKDTERELALKAEALAGTNREMEAFSYSLIHDLRNYLTRLSTAAQMLRTDHRASLDEIGSYLVDVICDTNEEMQGLIDDMMVLSRIIRSELRREEVDLSEMARGIAAGLQMGESDRPVEFVVAPGLTAVCDAHLIKVALENLLGNAWKYSVGSASPRVEFGAADHQQGKVFFVRDNGIGFDMNCAADLFKPFHRLENAKVFAGTGIGLATVYRVIQRHGGKVWGEGAAGKGATFCFTLPG